MEENGCLVKLEKFPNSTTTDELLSGLQSQLEEQSVTLRVLKHENEALRKVLGFGLPVSSSSSKSGSYLETKTLRELVEQIQLDVKEIKETIPSGISSTKKSSLLTVRSSECDKNCTCSITKEPPGEYVPKKIRSLTIDDEREWMNARFNEFKLQHEPSKNASEESIQKIFSTLQSRHSNVTSCGIKLTNYCRSTLSNPLYVVPPEGSDKCRLPSCIDGDKSEAICFQGSGETCWFLFSFDIGTTSLRLIIFGAVWSLIRQNYWVCQLGMGFSPTNLPMDKSLYDAWTADSFLLDDWMKSKISQTPVEIFSSQGNYFVRGHMTPGPHSVVNVEILEYRSQYRRPSILGDVKTTCSNSTVALDYLQRVSNLAGTSDGFTCLMEFVNGLDVSIKLRGCRSCERSRVWNEVLPLGLEMFFAAGKMSIEASFAYEIESTDVGLLVAVKAGENENKFAAVFLPVSEIMFDADLDKLLDQDTWGYLLSQKFAHARDGEKMFQTRNIMAKVKMTEGQKSQVKIRLYTV